MINVNMSSNLQGVQGWQQLGELVKAGGTEGTGAATVDFQGRQIVVTVNNGGKAQTVNISVPNLGVVEGAPDAAALQSLADKVVALVDALSATGAVGADGANSAKLQAAIAELQASLGVPQGTPTMNTNSTSKVLFDLFALMALMVEVAQKQRDTSREIRLTENQQVQNSIKQQAEEMRGAAMISLCFGVASALISGVMSTVALVKQSTAFQQQSSATKQMDVPAENLKTAQLASDLHAANANLQAVQTKTPQNIQTKVNEQFSAAREDFVRDITAADTRLQQAETAQDHAADELTAVRDPQRQPPATPEEIQTKTEAYDRASQEVAMAKQNRASIERGFFDKLDTQLHANEVAVSAKEDLIAAKQGELKGATAEQATALKGEIRTLTDEVKALKQENSYLRAYTAKAKAEHASDATKSRDLASAQSKYDFAKREMELDSRFSGSQQMMNRWMGIQQLTMSLSQMANASGNMVGEMVRASATMEGVEQTRHNEQLDQIKDLFSQAETMVQAVVQLMQAVLSAENESLMEAIRA